MSVGLSFDRDAVWRFEFADRSLDEATGVVRLSWRLIGAHFEHEFVERFEIAGPLVPGRARSAAVQGALDLLHWTAGVSYWKLACRGDPVFCGRCPDRAQAAMLTALYRDGLAELAWRNRLSAPWWPSFPVGRELAPAAPVGLRRRALVAIGGGKDSLVALERVRRSGQPFETVQVGNSALIAATVEGLAPAHRHIGRFLPPELAALNAAGAINGHVPITAINAAVLVLAALLWDFDAVVFANERSADAPTLLAADGSPVNHQYAKSFSFEMALSDWVRRSIAPDLDVFSVLRRDRELAVCREFAALTQHHGRFSSCNRNFHLDGPRTARWCLECPKCLFVFLCLAPFLDPERMRAIFGADLLADTARQAGFESLLELDGHRPFECVGEADEARAAVQLLAAHPAWRGHAGVAALSRRLAGLAPVDLEALLEPGGPHRIPERFAA